MSAQVVVVVRGVQQAVGHYRHIQGLSDVAAARDCWEADLFDAAAELVEAIRTGAVPEADVPEGRHADLLAHGVRLLVATLQRRWDDDDDGSLPTTGDAWKRLLYAQLHAFADRLRGAAAA